MCKHSLFSLIFLMFSSNAQALNSPSALQSVMKYWIDNEFAHSTLTPVEQRKELTWFSKAAQPYQGITVRVTSEDIATHRYESEVLTKAFYEITGINVIHELTEEDDVVKKMQIQMELGINLYDAYVNDVDFIGTHYRANKTVPISTMILNQWKNITLPSLDLTDFIGLDFAKGMDGVLYQLPTQQFANLYWYRHDWFSRKDIRAQFEKLYGYPLGVPQNWAAYEDIAEFFTDKLKYIDNKRVWGHMDYGLYDPSLGWRISDSWLSLAGVNDIIYPQRKNPHASQRGPWFDNLVGDWGIRIQNCHPKGASVAKGGAIDSPAAIYAVDKYVSWLHNYAPPDAKEQSFSTSTRYLAKGNIAQQIFWYSAFIPTVLSKNLVDKAGYPVWRVAPSPRGKYWRPGMKSGYQDVGGWTFLLSTPEKRRNAAWLYAQFVVSKTVSMKKFLVGFTPIRESDLSSDYLNSQSKHWGGLLEFYQSEARYHWTPTGLSVPDYAALSSAWWQYIGPAVSGKSSVTESMKGLAKEMDKRLQKIGVHKQLICKPILNKDRKQADWLNAEGSPWPENTVPAKPITLSYEEALEIWQTY